MLAGINPHGGALKTEALPYCGLLRLFGAAYRALPHAPDSTKTAQRFSFCSPAAHTLHTGGKIFQEPAFSIRPSTNTLGKYFRSFVGVRRCPHDSRQAQPNRQGLDTVGMAVLKISDSCKDGTRTLDIRRIEITLLVFTIINYQSTCS